MAVMLMHIFHVWIHSLSTESLGDTVQFIIVCNKSSMSTWESVILSQESVKLYFCSLIG